MKPIGSGHGLMLAMLWLLVRSAPLAADAHQDFLDGMNAEKTKTWDDAAQDFLRVSAKLPSYAPAWKQLATCRYYMNDFEGAAATAERYLRLVPNDSAFAHWDELMRAQNHLPPRVLPTPTPPPLIPTPVPSILQDAPPPDADAEPAGVQAPAQNPNSAPPGIVKAEPSPATAPMAPSFGKGPASPPGAAAAPVFGTGPQLPSSQPSATPGSVQTPPPNGTSFPPPPPLP